MNIAIATGADTLVTFELMLLAPSDTFDQSEPAKNKNLLVANFDNANLNIIKYLFYFSKIV